MYPRRCNPTEIIRLINGVPKIKNVLPTDERELINNQETHIFQLFGWMFLVLFWALLSEAERERKRGVDGLSCKNTF